MLTVRFTKADSGDQQGRAATPWPNAPPISRAAQGCGELLLQGGEGVLTRK